MLVGEGGMNPTYFHEQLTYYEAQDFITGYNRRCRHTYEAARMIHGVVGGLFAKNYHIPKFPWDNERRGSHHNHEDELTADELQRIIASKNGFMKDLNKKARS